MRSTTEVPTKNRRYRRFPRLKFGCVDYYSPILSNDLFFFALSYYLDCFLGAMDGSDASPRVRCGAFCRAIRDMSHTAVPRDPTISARLRH